MSGRRIGHDHILEKLAAGGMGEAYRATDTKLGREMAIKVLPEAVAEDPERLARFERDSKVLAALNDPNIAAIYSLELTADFERAGPGVRRAQHQAYSSWWQPPRHAVSPDARYLVMVKTDSSTMQATEIRIVQYRFEELERLVPPPIE